MTVTQIRKTHTTTAAAAPAPGTIAMTLDALQDAEALITTAMRALGADGDSPEEATLGFALQKLRAAMECVGGTPTTQD